MASSKLSENLMGREVERLFGEISAKRGDLCTNPVTGGDFVYGSDPIQLQKKMAQHALRAREDFARNGPADARRLPLKHWECERVRWSGRPLDYITGQYARSVVPLYNVKGHPSFDDYARGVLWEHDTVPESALPFTPEQLAEMRRRFPPRKLEGLKCFSWRPLKRQARPKEKRRAA
jgi:hypothetical protein